MKARTKPETLKQKIIRLSEAEADAIKKFATERGMSFQVFAVQALRAAAGMPVFEAPGDES